MSNALYSLARQNREALARFTTALVSIPSPTGHEGPIIERLAMEMKTIGYDEVTIDPMGNLIGRIGNGPLKIALDGHCDTVGVGNRSLWKRDPHTAAMENGILYGLGAGDQKGGLAAAIHSVMLLKQVGLPKNVTVYVIASVQEEDCDGLCWQYIVREDHLKPDVVVLTEPSGLCIRLGQRGRMEIEITVGGVSCHGSAPELGVNAIYKMAPIIRDIEQFNEHLPSRPPLGRGSVTISQIRSTAPSLCSVPDGCTIHLDRRLTAGETEDASVEELRALPSVKAAQAQVSVPNYAVPSWRGLNYPARKYYPAWMIPETALPVQKARAAFENTFGEQSEIGYWKFSTNGTATAGLFGIPTIGFGPGHEKFAHAPDEQIEIEHLVRASAFYAGFVAGFSS